MPMQSCVSQIKQIHVNIFGKFIAEYGEQKLMNALQKNESDGIIYHYKEQLVGDYDLPKSKKEIRGFILRGL